MHYLKLKKKIKSKKAKILIAGLGYVGFPILVQFFRKGFDCTGFDIDKKKIEQFKNNKFNGEYFSKIILKKKKHSSKLNKLNFTSNYKAIKDADVIIVSLPTPINNLKKPDLSAVKSFLKNIKNYIKEGQLISFESTVAPGTTEKVFGDLIQQKKFDLSKNFFLVYSPERENPIIDNINQKLNLYNIPKVCAGSSKACTDLGCLLYSKIIKRVVRTEKIISAEMTKMVENVYRSINIGLANELKIICRKMNINIFEVLRLASTKPFGFTSFSPGPGVGGHCIPIDPYYLIDKAKQFNHNSKFIALSLQINEEITNYTIKEIIKLFKDKDISKNDKILFLGAAYKANIDDVRESPAIKIISYFKNKKYKINYCDPYVKNFEIDKKKIQSISLNYNSFKKYSVVIILTDHKKFIQKKLVTNSRLIIDTRGFLKNIKNKKIIYL